MKSLPLYYFTCFLFIANFVSCFSQENTTSSNLLTTKQDGSLNNWFQRDELQDSIPGISLDKWYKQNKKVSKAKEIIVAVIDTKIDLKHEDLQNQIWINTKEIANNGIDDDSNGFIDDVNGWNFLGYSNGDYIKWGNNEFVRIIRKWSPVFKDKTAAQLSKNELNQFKEYQRAQLRFDTETKFYKNWLRSLQYLIQVYPLVKDTLKHYFPKEDYTSQQLDSLYQKHKINDKSFRRRRDDNDKDLGALIDYMRASLASNQNTLTDIQDQELQLNSIENECLNLEFNERHFINDDVFVAKGNNEIVNTIKKEHTIENHSTLVSGIIAADRTNDIGIKGITHHTKIMPLVICNNADEHDNDIAAAIRYAVDNYFSPLIVRSDILNFK